MQGGLNLCEDCLDIMAFILKHANEEISEEDLKELLLVV